MNKIEKLIKELCPNGVEWKKLGEIAKNLDSKRKPITSSKRTTGEYPYYGASGIVDYIDNYIFDGDYLLISEDGANLVARNTPIAFSINGKTWVNNHAHVLFIENYFCRKFIEVYLNSISLEPYISGGAQPKLNQENLNKILIPLPPLPIQTEIVRILDKFVEQQEQLERLIELRKKQYEYYREEMLKPKEGEKWEKVIMSDVCDLKAGKAISASELNDSNAYPCYGGNGIRGYISKYSHEGNFAIIGRQGALCGCVNWATKKFYATEHAVVVTPKNGNDSRFLYLLFTRANLNQYKSAGAQPGLAVNKLNELYFTIPSSKKQKQIVKILDFFETSIATLTTALEVSKKRYEYYRDKMMRF